MQMETIVQMEVVAASVGQGARIISPLIWEILRHLLNANCGQLKKKIAVFQCEIECIAVATMIIVLKFAIVLAY